MSESEFKPAWWLPHAHMQTLWPTLCRRDVNDFPIKRERFELPDGDFIDLDWVDQETGPIILVLHGLEGSIRSSYAKGILRSFYQKGWRGVLMHFRGCSGEPNRLMRTYHSGETNDLAAVIESLQEREPGVQIAAIGFSLGGNVLLKWLGETGANNPLIAAVAICVPFELNKTAQRIQEGFSRIYQWHLLKCLCTRLVKKYQLQTAPFDISIFDKLQSIREFDDKITAPLHGFADADEYYRLSSSRPYLRHIQVPTLILQSKDDPFMTADIIPQTHELSSSIQLELTNSGGHVGFVSGQFPWSANYWLEQRIPAFLKEYLE